MSHPKFPFKYVFFFLKVLKFLLQQSKESHKSQHFSGPLLYTPGSCVTAKGRDFCSQPQMVPNDTTMGSVKITMRTGSRNQAATLGERTLKRTVPFLSLARSRKCPRFPAPEVQWRVLVSYRFLNERLCLEATSEPVTSNSSPDADPFW